ncbi:MAG: ribonuclease III [Jatrophihabitans sp.]
MQSHLGVSIDAQVLLRALTHRSYSYENGSVPHNERLEFLGDAVLSIVITDRLYRTHPDLPEGKLARLRSSVVNMHALAEVARGIGPNGLGAFVRLGRGEVVTGGRDKHSILADTLEAVIGAVYVDSGLPVARAMIHRFFDPVLERAANQGAALDWKTSLQELTALMGLGVPQYVVESEGPDHERTFTARVEVAGEPFPYRSGKSKKEAEQAAASAAWQLLRERSRDLPLDDLD